jgi:hypothetical protein
LAFSVVVETTANARTADKPQILMRDFIAAPPHILISDEGLSPR